MVQEQMGGSAGYLGEVVWFSSRRVDQLVTWLKLYGSVAGGWISWLPG
jgi:hypothetical protein